MWRERGGFPCLTLALVASQMALEDACLGRKNCQTDRVGTVIGTALGGTEVFLSTKCGITSILTGRRQF